MRVLDDHVPFATESVVSSIPQRVASAGLAELSRLLRERRAGLPIAELARCARVSPRTIVALENTPPERISSRVVIRLATALATDVHTWLHAAGYAHVPDALIARVRARQADKREVLASDVAPTERATDDPVHFFERLAAASDLDTQLLTTVYAAAPRALDRVDVRTHLVEALRRGLWIALLLPFPSAGPTRSRRMPLLGLHFAEIEARVLALRDSLLDAVPASRHARVRVFRFASGERIDIAPAPLSARPVFLSRFDADPTTMAGHALYTWVDAPQGDVFWRIHDGEQDADPSERAQVWHELCRDVFLAWQAGGGATWGALPSHARWTLVDDGAR